MLKLPKVIKHQEVLELFSKAKNARDKLLLEVIYYCGLRVSEAINITRENVDLKEGVIKVNYFFPSATIKIPVLSFG